MIIHAEFIFLGDLSLTWFVWYDTHILELSVVTFHSKPFLPGSPLQRIQLLFPPGACDLPAIHRRLTSPAEMCILLLRNIFQRHLQLPVSLCCCHPDVAGAAETQFMECQWTFRYRNFSSVQWGEDRVLYMVKCFVLGCSDQMCQYSTTLI